MKKKWNGIDRRMSLRTEAETMTQSFFVGANSTNPIEMLMHELLVHKIELEIQNEELQRAYAAMEEARDRYLDFYEFSPIGYITINRDGMISEINLAGAALLGVDRAKLINQRFSVFVPPPDKDRWHHLFMHMMKHTKNEQQKFGLQMTRADGSRFYGHFDCLRKETLGAPPVLRVALSDITQQKATFEQTG